MKQGEGMSFAEFSYPLLQAWDWWHMYSTKDIQVQVGGSDQFGNILAGIDAVNYIRFNHFDPDTRHDEKKMRAEQAFLKKPMGFTVPLLTTKSGEKFGKSAGNAVWLDQELTSAFELYQVSRIMLSFYHGLTTFSSSSGWRMQTFIDTSNSSPLNHSTYLTVLCKSTTRILPNEWPSIN
jgi:hypothetical protein